MSTVKIDKDVFVRDEYNVRRRVFVAGTEVPEYVYNEVFRKAVPVTPEELPQKPEFIGTEALNGSILPENKMLFDEVVKDEKKAKVDSEQDEVEDEDKGKAEKTKTAKK